MRSMTSSSPLMMGTLADWLIHSAACSFSFVQAISIAPLQVPYYSEVLPTQHGYCVGVSRLSATGNCE